ncbi:hypothetical protein BDD12DRAFT_878262 [Trichophaea hybrida]|nr:hypothetical protein BDD12DRAFT_878262 [Trichophaea hybrida]
MWYTYRLRVVDSLSAQVVSLEWFRDAPKFLKYQQLMEKGGHVYYANRAEISYCNIYLCPNTESPPPYIDGLFIFCDQSSLKEFTQKFKADVTAPGPPGSDGVPFRVFVLRQLLQQVFDGMAGFLEAIALEINNAKRDGRLNPERTNIEFFLSAEEYLRGMPQVLKKAVQTIEGLSEPMEVAYDKQMFVNIMQVRQTEKATTLTILATVFVPMSFLIAFFSMNFQELNYSSNKTAPRLKLYWFIAIPLATIVVILPFMAGILLRFFIRMNRFIHWRFALDAVMCSAALSNFFYFTGVAKVVVTIYLAWLFVSTGFPMVQADRALLKTRRWPVLWENIKTKHGQNTLIAARP